MTESKGALPGIDHWHLVTLSLALLLAPSTSLAQTSDQARIAARDLGYEGLEAYDNGDITVAIQKLSRAYELLPVPTLALWLGRAEEKQGHLVEASERYLEATRFTLETDAPKVQRDAQASASKEREALLPRIPKLVVQVVGAPRRDVTVLVGGRPMDNAVVGVPVPFNPGEVLVVGQYRGERVRQQVTLQESQEAKAVLEFNPYGTDTGGVAPQNPRTTPAPEAIPSRQEPANHEPILPPQVEDHAASSTPTLGYVALGVGGLGIAVGATTGLVALSKKGTLDKNCKPGCPPEYHAENNSYETMRNVSTVGFIVGAVGAGVGLGLLLTDSSETEVGAVRRLEASVGADGVTLRGQF